MRRAFAVCTLALILLIAACATAPPNQGQRLETAHAIAAKRGWQETQIDTRAFVLKTWGPEEATDARADALWIYIEGDGLAYLGAERISDDPTPVAPLALALALAQPEGLAVYLARPCQYLAHADTCSSKYWTDRRFSPEVIESMNEAVATLKARYQASRLTLVGYSGGAAIAALLAARRSDVVRLVTVAGNLSIKAWTDAKFLSPLRGSLDPADERQQLVHIDQWHFVGGADEVVPANLTEAFTAGMPHAHLVREDDFDHRCCWVDAWPRLWALMN